MADPWDDGEAGAGAYANADLDQKPINKVDEHERNRRLWQNANAHPQFEVIRQDSTRTQYVPQLRLLQRPTGSTGTATHHSSFKSGDQSSSHSAQQQKTLAEREKEYLAARQKIFGESGGEDEGPNGQERPEREKRTRMLR
ncbi:2315_t:CDS:2 [Paraglomus occultum]|uniref:2315_t:CDS:1 n=1 Tax=Paraglomus occultum TaxID=144539 RepID=A0A9N9FHT8_9GLOM|nr:2315_t:CDS:2 [Paraglomus occultum]